MRNSAIKVLQLSHGIYPYSQAGTEIYTLELAEALRAKAVEVTVAIPATPKVRQGKADGQLPDFVHPIERASAGKFGNKFRHATFRGALWKNELRNLIANASPDIIHVHHAVGFGISALELLASSGRPLVITLPDFWLLCPGILRSCGGNLRRCARECCGDIRVVRKLGIAALPYVAMRRHRVRRFVHRSRPLMAAISGATCATFLKEGFPQELLVTQTWGIDAEKIRAAGQSQCNLGKVRIAYLGTMRPHKGCHVLLEAFSQMSPGHTLSFYGGGDESYIQQLKADSQNFNVQFHGRFDHADVGRILSQVDIVVIPSIWEETYCLVAQEAMAARKPVIASNVGGMADRLVHGINGFLVPPNDPYALATQMRKVISKLPEFSTQMDFGRCVKTMEQDASEWIDIYQRARNAN